MLKRKGVKNFKQLFNVLTLKGENVQSLNFSPDKKYVVR